MINSTIEINGTNIHTVDWDIPNPKATLIIVHGYAEHCRRYDHVAQFFNEASFHVRSFDFFGHGKSGGLRGHVENFDVYVDELESIVSRTKALFPNLPIFILGHSMGGTITGLAAAKHKLSGCDKIILSNPGLDITSNQPAILITLIRILSKYLPKVKTTKLSSEFISRDPEERKKYDSDPLNYREGARPGFANEFDTASTWLRTNASKIDQKIYLNYSLCDKVVYPQASEDFYDKISSVDKTKTHYEGLYHELLNEPEKAQVMQNMLDWCLSKI